MLMQLITLFLIRDSFVEIYGPAVTLKESVELKGFGYMNGCSARRLLTMIAH